MKNKKYQIIAPSDIKIKGLQLDAIKSIQAILKEEGCPASENLFSDKEMGIKLDEIQEHLAKVNKTNKNSSADLLICVKGSKYLLADAKFDAHSVNNIETKEAKDKLRESKSLVQSNESCATPFYFLFTGKVLTNSSYNRIKRKFNNNPAFDFMTTMDFYSLFEH